MIKKFLDGTLTALAYGIATLVGVALAAAAFVWHFIPKRDKERKQEAARKAAEIKAEIQKAHEARAAETEVAVKAIEKKAEDARSADSVALANDLLKE